MFFIILNSFFKKKIVPFDKFINDIQVNLRKLKKTKKYYINKVKNTSNLVSYASFYSGKKSYQHR